MEDIFITSTLLQNLHTAPTFSRKLEHIHASLKQLFGFIHRISVILYDPPTQTLKTYAAKGCDIIDTFSEQMGLQSFKHIYALRNISQSHHETTGDKGYSRQLENDEFPSETQIVSVTDIFDALTSKRTYKKAWSIDDAFDDLKKLAPVKINSQCVDALIQERDAVEKIQQPFKD